MSAHSASAPTSQQATQTSTRRVLSQPGSTRSGDANRYAPEDDAYGQGRHEQHRHEQDTYGQESHDQEAQPQDELAYRDDGAGCYPLNPVLLDKAAANATADASLATASGVTSSAMVANVTAAEGSATGAAGIGPIPAGPANAAGAGRGRFCHWQPGLRSGQHQQYRNSRGRTCLQCNGPRCGQRSHTWRRGSGCQRQQFQPRHAAFDIAGPARCTGKPEHAVRHCPER